MAKIKVKNLLLRTYIGFNPEELVNKQDVMINFEIVTEIPGKALKTDEPEGIYDYKVVTKKIIHLVQEGRFKLMEVLTKKILDLILEDERVKWARVEVDKPHALRFAESVSMEMEEFQTSNIENVHRHGSGKNIVILGIGSNINAEENISKMLELLKDQVDLLKISSFKKTKPIGIEDQPDFTNGAVKIQTSLNRNALNKLLKSIEDELGRARSAEKFGPRTMDLDIVVWNGEIEDKDYYTRDFLKKSVQEVM